MSYTSGSHTVFHHRYHIVWITKYRYKVLEGALRERIGTSGRSARNWASRSSPAFCRENMSICSWKSRRILRSATSCGASRDGHRIGCRWSSRTCASATGGGAAFDHAQKLIQAKDPQEILAHQAEYMKKQLAAAEEHAKELGRQ